MSPRQRLLPPPRSPDPISRKKERMLRSMFSAVSGLQSHQTMMDVIGNDIANVNTVGYKSSSVVFEDLLSQTIKGAGVAAGGATGSGGTNPAQVGLGVTVAGI